MTAHVYQLVARRHVRRVRSQREPPQLSREGPRERLARLGAEALSDAELLAVLLGTGRRGEHVTVLAARVDAALRQFGAYDHLAVETIAEIDGVGLAKAARVLAAIELGRRWVRMPIQRGSAFRTSDDVAQAYAATLGRLRYEKFVAISLDAEHRVIAEHCIAIGSITEVSLNVADAFRPVIARAAVAVVFVHNHPSGNSRPSDQDTAFTRRLTEAGALLGIDVLDHVIVTADSHYSFADAGLL